MEKKNTDIKTIVQNIIDVAKVSDAAEVKILLKKVDPQNQGRVVYKILQNIREVAEPESLTLILNTSHIAVEKYLKSTDPIDMANKLEQAEQKMINIRKAFKNSQIHDNETLPNSLKPGSLVNTNPTNNKALKLNKTQPRITKKTVIEIANQITSDVEMFAEQHVGKKVDEKEVQTFFKQTLDLLEKNGNINQTENLRMSRTDEFYKEVKEVTTLLNISIPKISLSDRVKMDIGKFLTFFKPTREMGKDIQARVSAENQQRIVQITKEVALALKGKKIFKPPK